MHLFAPHTTAGDFKVPVTSGREVVSAVRQQGFDWFLILVQQVAVTCVVDGVNFVIWLFIIKNEESIHNLPQNSFKTWTIFGKTRRTDTLHKKECLKKTLVRIRELFIKLIDPLLKYFCLFV